MALSKSGKAGSNVSKLDDARKTGARSGSPPRSVAAKAEVAQLPLAPEEVAAGEAKPAPKARPKVSNRRFNTVKVERLKSEIANGEYQIDYLNVADKFIEHERYA